MAFIHSSLVDATTEEVFAWHARPGAIIRLTPPWRPVQVISEAESLRDGRAVPACRAGCAGLGTGMQWLAWPRRTRKRLSSTGTAEERNDGRKETVMARYQATVESGRPAAELFAYLATFSNAVEWDPGVLAGEQLDPGPVAVGTRFRLVVPFLGRRMSLTYRVTSYQPGHEVVLTATSGLLHATDKILVAGRTGGSAVSYAAEVRLRGPLRVLDPLLRPGFRAVAQRAAAGLAQELSREPGVEAPAPPGWPAQSAGTPPLPRDAR